jgi:hypothetical protein
MQAQHPLLRPLKPKRRLKVRHNLNRVVVPSLRSNSSTSSARKYIDYFTDGTKTYPFPGNPDIDSNLNKPNAPIPSHSGLTWVSTSGMDAYDTASGDLEVGDYAQESDGSYISNVPAYTYTDATSSVPIAAHIATSKTDPTTATSQ